jgi:hypothetical protein
MIVLIAGLPHVGQKLLSRNENGFGASAQGPGASGSVTRIAVAPRIPGMGTLWRYTTPQGGMERRRNIGVEPSPTPTTRYGRSRAPTMPDRAGLFAQPPPRQARQHLGAERVVRRGS